MLWISPLKEFPSAIVSDIGKEVVHCAQALDSTLELMSPGSLYSRTTSDLPEHNNIFTAPHNSGPYLISHFKIGFRFIHFLFRKAITSTRWLSNWMRIQVTVGGRHPGFRSHLCSAAEPLGSWRIPHTWIGLKRHLTPERVGLPGSQRLQTELRESNLGEICCTSTHWPGGQHVSVTDLQHADQLLSACTRSEGWFCRRHLQPREAPSRIHSSRKDL